MIWRNISQVLYIVADIHANISATLQEQCFYQLTYQIGYLKVVFNNSLSYFIMLVLRCDDHVLLLVNLPWYQKDSLICPNIWSFSGSVPGSELCWYYEIFMHWQIFWKHFYSDRFYYIRFHWLELILLLGMGRNVVTNSHVHAVLDVIFVWFISISRF